jgi:hypothetical protein
VQAALAAAIEQVATDLRELAANASLRDGEEGLLLRAAAARLADS